MSSIELNLIENCWRVVEKAGPVKKPSSVNYLQEAIKQARIERVEQRIVRTSFFDSMPSRNQPVSKNLSLKYKDFILNADCGRANLLHKRTN